MLGREGSGGNSGAVRGEIGGGEFLVSETKVVTVGLNAIRLGAKFEGEQHAATAPREPFHAGDPLYDIVSRKAGLPETCLASPRSRIAVGLR